MKDRYSGSTFPLTSCSVMAQQAAYSQVAVTIAQFAFGICQSLLSQFREVQVCYDKPVLVKIMSMAQQMSPPNVLRLSWAMPLGYGASSFLLKRVIPQLLPYVYFLSAKTQQRSIGLWILIALLSPLQGSILFRQSRNTRILSDQVHWPK